MSCILVIKGVLCTGELTYDFPTVTTFENLLVLVWVWLYKRDKTYSIATIPIKFQTLVVKILLKHKMNEVFFLIFFVRKVVFEQLNFCHLERIAFYRNWRGSCRKDL